MVDVNRLIDTMAQEEEDFFDSSFLAPVVGPSKVRTRISGVVVTFDIQRGFEGWGIFRPVSWKSARLVSKASIDEIDGYLNLFPRMRVILSELHTGFWLAHPANSSDTLQRFGWKRGEFRRVLLATGVEQFEQIICRFDGSNLWFEDIDSARDPLVAEHLRQAFKDHAKIADLQIPTLTPEEKIAFALASGLELVRSAEAYGQDPTGAQLQRALRHADADLVSYIDQGDTLLVRFTVDGVEYASSVAKGDLTIVAAGICLSGQDRNFDLTSLVGVLREGRGSGMLNPPHGEYDE